MFSNQVAGPLSQPQDPELRIAAIDFESRKSADALNTLDYDRRRMRSYRRRLRAELNGIGRSRLHDDPTVPRRPRV